MPQDLSYGNIWSLIFWSSDESISFYHLLQGWNKSQILDESLHFFLRLISVPLFPPINLCHSNLFISFLSLFFRIFTIPFFYLCVPFSVHLSFLFYSISLLFFFRVCISLPVRQLLLPSFLIADAKEVLLFLSSQRNW